MHKLYACCTSDAQLTPVNLRFHPDFPILTNGTRRAIETGMAHGNFQDLLRNKGFRAFLWTQFLGAFNDCLFQSVTIFRAEQVKGGMYVPLVAAVFVMPSLL